MSRPFVPLHLKTHASILTGASRIGDIVSVAAENNMPAIALTDNGVMYGALDHYLKAKDAGVKPIIGCNLYVIEGDPKDRVSKRHMSPTVLLAKNTKGYQNLVSLVSRGHQEGFYYKPRISWDQLAQSSEGLIVLTGGLSGCLAHPILRNNPQEARDRATWLKDVFGDDVYLEQQYHGLESEARVIPEIWRLSNELGIKSVITNDSHYTRPEDATIHDILLCLQNGKTLNDTSRFRFHSTDYYLKNGDEMANAFAMFDKARVDQALEMTLEVADKCNLEFTLDESILPDYPVPDGLTPESYLDQLVHSHAEARYGTLTDEHLHRIRHELDVINHMGFPAYFLIVWDFINFSKKNAIPVGPGRGSAAGSIVAYALGITSIDPIEHNLLFERFLNPERISMPDIDIDFCIDRREKVIQYVTERYGQERVAQIITFGTFAARAAVKAVGRVLDVPFAESDRIAKLIPTVPGTKLKDAMADVADLKKLYETDEKVKEIMDLALRLEGTNASTGVHAAGVVISKDPLNQVVPLQVSKEGQIVTQYSMDNVASLGLLKMDFLGLRNLTIMDKTVNLVAKHRHESLDMEQLELNDPAVFSMLSSGETDGVFQLESGGMKALVKELKPTVFEDINALVALFRPGPLNSGMVEEFVKRKHGKSKVEYEHDDLIPILEPTYGTIVYQEQIMQIAQVLAGYTLGQADLLRRAMGKKKESEMLKQQELFVTGATSRNVSEAIATKLFDAMTEFAKYCFNRSHSAAYAMISYQTAWLKVHYPVEYLSALLSSVSSDLDKIQLYILTARKMGIAVLPPDINASDADFTPQDQAIRFGLASIKNVGEGLIERILEIRGESPFATLAEFCERVELKTVNRRAMESLIHTGALDSFGISRRQLFHNIDNMYSYAARLAERKETGQVSLFAALGGGDAADTSGYQDGLNLSGEGDEYPPEEIQGFEKSLLGAYVSSHPLDDVRDTLAMMATASAKELKEMSDGTIVIIAGLLTTVVNKITKTNKPLRIAQLEDFTGGVEVVAFSDSLGTYGDMLQDGRKLAITGKLQFRGDDSCSVVVQSARPLDTIRILQLRLKGIPRYEDMHRLREELLKTKGDDPVVLCWEDKTQMLVGPQFWVNYDQALTSLAPALANGLGESFAFAPACGTGLAPTSHVPVVPDLPELLLPDDDDMALAV